MELLYKTFLDGTSKEEALKHVIAWSKEVKIENTQRPKVAIFGDFYARDNDVFNQDLIRNEDIIPFLTYANTSE